LGVFFEETRQESVAGKHLGHVVSQLRVLVVGKSALADAGQDFVDRGGAFVATQNERRAQPWQISKLRQVLWAWIQKAGNPKDGLYVDEGREGLRREAVKCGDVGRR
jgi:hypothetical protein